MRFDPIPFDFNAALNYWGLVMGVVLAGLVLLWLLISILVRGPVNGIGFVFKSIGGGIKDFVTLSPRRVYSLTKLTVKEAVRRKALLVFVVFAVLFMFGAWFLPSSTDRSDLQVKVYISFVMTAISWLVLPVMLLLACWGLPEDIRQRSLHTVVTKPARRLEILLGRIMGYSFVGLFVLGIMSTVGYIWLWRQIAPETPVASIVRGDIEDLNCRVPIRGDLIFHNRQGQPTREGINVGDEWKFRSYIEGATKARAIWTFENIDKSRVQEGSLRLEALFESFRTVKGKMSSGLICQYTLVNNMRESAFGSFSIAPALAPASEFLRNGQFDVAGEELKKASQTILEEASLLNSPDVDKTGDVARFASNVLEKANLEGDWNAELIASLRKVDDACVAILVARQAGSDGDIDALSTALNELGTFVSDNASRLQEGIVSLEVPLNPFEIAEYRDGDNIYEIDQEIEWEGNDEDVARYLAGVFAARNAEGNFVEGDSLSAAAIDELIDSKRIDAEDGGEILTSAFGELFSAGTLKTADGKIELAEGQTFYSVFNGLVKDGKIAASQGWKLKADLFQDVVRDGVLTVSVACLSSNQYVGMARPDLFVRLPDSPFGVSYYKAIGAIALMIILIVVLGVTASTFVKGPVATLLTGAFVVFGKPLYAFMTDLVEGEVLGGGVMSSIYRMIYHMNQTTEIEAAPWLVNIIDKGDKAIALLPQAAKGIIPNFNHFTSPAQFVENKFDVDWNAAMLPCIMTTIAVLIPCLIIGNFSLKHRELEAK